MENILKNKKIIISLVVIIVLIISMLFIFKKDDKLKNVQDSLENIFFFLPETKYDNLNDLPDYCKVSLVYGTKYLKDEKYLSKDDYNTEGKKKALKTVKAYSKESILDGVKLLLGENATINFEKNEEGDYTFTQENGCGYNNDSIDLLSYNEIRKLVYSYDTGENNTIDLYVKWEKPEIDGDIVKLSAKALLPIDNGDGNYIVYADKDMSLVAGRIEKGKNLEKEIEKLYDTGSRIYNFTLKKHGNNYIWIGYEVLDYMYNNEIFID